MGWAALGLNPFSPFPAPFISPLGSHKHEQSAGSFAFDIAHRTWSVVVGEGGDGSDDHVSGPSSSTDGRALKGARRAARPPTSHSSPAINQHPAPFVAAGPRAPLPVRGQAPAELIVVRGRLRVAFRLRFCLRFCPGNSAPIKALDLISAHFPVQLAGPVGGGNNSQLDNRRADSHLIDRPAPAPATEAGL